MLRRRLSSVVTVAKEFSSGSKDSLKVSAAPTAAAPGSKQVLLGLVAAPVWENDVLALKGLAPGAAVGSTPGTTGVFQVAKVGPGASKFAVGDLAMPVRFSFGTWRAQAVANEDELVKVPSSLSSAAAAVDLMAHATALRLLDGLKKGDVVGCAGAQGPLGLALAIVGKALGLRVVCINGPTVDPVHGLKKLKDAGAELVVPHEWSNGASYTGSYKFRRLVEDLPPAKLVVNLAGGSMASDASRLLDGGGEFVTLGGAPFTLPASFFTQRRAVARGFDMAAWLKQAKISEAQDLCDRAAKSVASSGEDFASQVTPFALDEVATAVDAEGFGPIPVLQVQVTRPFAQPVGEPKLEKMFKTKRA